MHSSATRVAHTMGTLTSDAIHQLIAGHNVTSPVVQVCSINNLREGLGEANRYSLDISDGMHVHQASLPMKYNENIALGEIKVGSIIQLTKYNYSTSNKAR